MLLPSNWQLWAIKMENFLGGGGGGPNSQKGFNIAKINNLAIPLHHKARMLPQLIIGLQSSLA